MRLFSSALKGVWIVPLKAGIDYQLDMEFLLIQISVTRMWLKGVLSSPSESISVTYARDRSAYVVDIV